MTLENDLPDPLIVEKMAEEAAPKVPLRDYLSAMQTLREKRYSYQDIAQWMTSNLGVQVTRGQVSYVMNAAPDVLEAEELEEREDAEDERHP